MTLAPSRVLLVEDNPGDARLVCEALKQASNGRFEVACADRLAAALDRLRRETYHVVLLDLSLPDSQGLDTLRRVREHTPRTAVVVLTGNDDEALARTMLQKGAQDYLVKGMVESEGLSRAIRHAIDRKRAEEQIAFHASLLDKVRHSVAATDRTGKIVYWNRHAEEAHGWPAEAVLGRRFTDVIVPPDSSDAVQRQIARLFSAERVEGEFMPRRRDGSTFPAWMSIAAIDEAGGGGAGFVAVWFDISDRKRAEMKLKDSEEFYRALYEHARHPVLIVDAFLNVNDANPYACAFYGYSHDDFCILNLADFTQNSDDEDAVADPSSLLRDEHRHVKEDGEVINVALNAVEVTRSGQPLYVLTVTDISEQKRTQLALEHRVFHDTLTGLANRFLYNDRLNQAIRIAQRQGTSVSLLIMDLDRFKEINDTFGHHFGDLLLTALGPRLQHVLRGSDTLARLGGDEFAVLLPNTGETGAIATAERLHQALEEPFLIEGQPLAGAASIGIAVFPVHGDDSETLMRHADIAMYTAKRSGGGHYAIYTANQDQNSATRLTLVAEMRAAIEANQFYLQYQPLVSFANGDAQWVEALARWQHPQRGFIPPDQFIPLAEETGLIEPLTRWVLATALHQCRIWREQGITIGVAVNLSARSLLDAHLSDVISLLLEAHRVPAERLRLEITESTIMMDPERALTVLTRLAEMGVRLSIDDFGTGYSSLSSLRQLPVDELKIDKSFVLALATEGNDPVIVRSTIDLAHNLGLKVVAEGIENQETWDCLRALGCDLAQGYFLGRPMAAEALADWLAGSNVLVGEPAATPSARLS